MPVIGRQARNVGEPVEVDIVVEMIVDEGRYPVEAGFIDGTAIACRHGQASRQVTTRSLA